MKEIKSVLEISWEQLTPGMRQYQEAKKQHPDCLIMLRMGDFYEMFYEDAVTASRELEITLTARGKGDKKAPLAGVPYHALEPYLARLVKKGYKVAIVEQLEDPKKAKGLVKRGLVRIITPGTVIDSSMLKEQENNYLMCFTIHDNLFTTAFCDLSTGEFFTKDLGDSNSLLNEISRLNPSECLIPQSLMVDKELVEKIRSSGCFVNPWEDYHFKVEKAQESLLQHFHLTSLESFGLEDKKINIAVSGALLQYLTTTQKNELSHLKKISLISDNQKMTINSATLRNLEIMRNLRDNTERGTLLSVIDKTITSLGARMLRQWLKNPLQNKFLIERRLNALETINKSVIRREEIIALLHNVYDLERLIGRINYGNALPKDLLAIKISLLQIPQIRQKIISFSSLISSPENLLQELQEMSEMNDLTNLLEQSIKEDAPATIREGGIIKPEFNDELKELHLIKNNSRKYLQDLQKQEQEKTGISTLKINYNKVLGYFIEVTKKNLPLVPKDYIRKQTTANSERFVTEKLKEVEEKILGAEEKIVELEYNLFKEVCSKVAEKTEQIQETARKLAVLDVICSLAKTALENRYVKPQIVDENVLQIKNGRHPVVEKIESKFIANDTILNEGEMMIITGPNMAGKTTVMRQAALIVLMAQMGSFVPAEEAMIGLVDQIFTRVGAADDISAGQSTFMVEMSETAYILNNATERSLIILDEIGRGTSTFDGVSLAWSVAEYLHNHTKAKTMFATHYHVMNKLAEKFSMIKNYNIAVKEVKGEVIFLHKLISGGTDQSYGIHVAKLAGLPDKVVERAKEIQALLEKDDDMMEKIKARKLQEQKSLQEF